jgi:chemotaxis signal transduction protein
MTNPLEFLALEPDPSTVDGSADDRERRELLIARRGGHLIGVFAATSEGIVEWKEPTPLPKAAPAVMGVVCVRGRMFTVLDPGLLVSAESRTQA